MKNKLFMGVLFAIALCLTNPVGAKTSTFSKDGILYELLENGTLKVLADSYYDDNGEYFGRYSGNIVIPDMIDEHMVMSIDRRAFDRCPNLLSVKLPMFLQEIGEAAFTRCAKLSSITIPANVTSIGEGAFSYGHFKEINVESGNTVYSSEDGVLYNYSKTKLIAFPTEKELDDFLYIKEGVEEIGDEAFYSNGFLKDVTIVLPTTTVSMKGMTTATPMQSRYGSIDCDCMERIPGSPPTPMEFAVQRIAVEKTPATDEPIMPQNNGKAIGALVCGIISVSISWLGFLFMFIFSWVLGILSVTFGSISLAKDKGVGRGKAITGIVTGALGIILSLLFTIIMANSL